MTDVNRIRVGHAGGKWTFQLLIGVGAPIIEHQHGNFAPRKVLLISTATTSKIEVSGTLVGRPTYGSQPGRTQVYNISGYPQHPEPPPWLLELLRMHAFPRVEV